MLNPYIAFSMDERKKIIAENPKLKSDIGGVAKLIGAKWRKLSDAEKAKYKGRAGKAGTRKAKKVSLKDDEGEVVVQKSKKSRKARKLSGFMKFAKSERSNIVKTNPTMAFGDIGKELGKRWRSLSDGDKKRFN